MDYKILIAGDSAVTVEFSRSISDEAGKRVMSFASKLEKMNVSGISDIIPTYRSVTICFNPLILDYKKLEKVIKKCQKGKISRDVSGLTYKIPVCYGGKFGEDLPFVASNAGLSQREVVSRHISTDYQINMIGFLPGFPYLSGLDKSICTPRLETPRTVIPAGSVGIGGNQTGIYPMSSPGGWRLIGKTPVKPYDTKRSEPVIYKAGDKIRFYPITEAEFYEIEARVTAGLYNFEVLGGTNEL